MVEVPVGSTATIGHTAVASVRKAISVYVLYPEWSRALQTIGTTATTTTDAAVTIASASCNGCIIYAGGQDATLGTFTTTWGGTDAVIEDIDAQLEGTASYTSGHVNLTESSFTNALTLAESTSGTKALVAISLRPPYRGR